MELNTNRLCQVIRWHLIANKKYLLRGTLGACLGMLAASLGGTGFLWSWKPVSIIQVYNISTVMFIITTFMMMYFATTIFKPTRTKTEFINYAMLPATKLEKFVASWLYVTIGMIILMGVGYLAGDIIQLILTFLVTGEAHSYTLAMLSHLCNIITYNGEFSICGTTVMLILIIFQHSTYILGGCFYRKHPFLLTCLTWVALPTILSFVVVLILSILPLPEGNFHFDLAEYLSVFEFGAICAIIAIAFICLNYWLSFRLYSRMQVINNKIYN